MSSAAPIRVLAFMEAVSVTGPAKNLIGFARRARPDVELSFATFRRPSVPDQGFVAALTEAQIPVHAVDESRVGDPRVIPQLQALLRTERPHIIQTHHSKSHFLLRLFRPRGTPWIAFHHGFTDRDRKDRAYNQVGKWAIKGADRVIAVCNAFASDLRAAGVPDSKISLRHNFVVPFTPPPPAEVDDLRGRLGIPPGVPVVLAVGRLSREKGHADLLEAVSILCRSGDHPDFRVVIAGEGPERANLEAQRSALGLGSIVLLAGHQADVRPFYALADIMALPSHSEGSPNVLLEALSAGLPVAATDAGGILEIAVDGQSALISRTGRPPDRRRLHPRSLRRIHARRLPFASPAGGRVRRRTLLPCPVCERVLEGN
jgi:glycosyltransferase involved in cell wall biosynthesis